MGISIEQVERAEAEAWFDLEAAMPEPLRGEQGLVARRIGGAVVSSVRADTSGYWSQKLGLGHDEPEPISPARARSWARMTADLFGSQLAGIPEMFEACVGRRGWHVFGVWHGDQLVSGGLSVAIDGVALLFAGATRPGFRGRGTQSALIVARARAAAQAGCRWLVTQTETEGPGTHNSSLHNLLRLGFEAVYERPGWALKP